MLRRHEDFFGVVDGHDRVLRRVQDEERLAERADRSGGVTALRLTEELLGQFEGPPADVDRRFAFGEELVLVRQEVLDMPGIVRRADRRDRARLRDVSRGGKHGRAAEAVADEY